MSKAFSTRDLLIVKPGQDFAVVRDNAAQLFFGTINPTPIQLQLIELAMTGAALTKEKK